MSDSREKEGYSERNERLELLSDKELVMKCLEGQRECFDEVVKRHYMSIYIFVVGRVNDAQLADDLVQETFIEGYKSLKNCRNPEFLPRWLMGIARNRCSDWYRKQKSRKAVPLEYVSEDQFLAGDDHELIEKEIIADTIQDKLADLPEDVVRILDLKHKEGLTCNQISDQLGIPVGTIKSKLSRTYRDLREQLQGFSRGDD